MKRIIAITAALLMLTACSGKSDKEASSKTTASSTDTAALNIDTLDKYVTLCEYKGLEIDWNATSNSQYLDDALSSYTAEKVLVTDRGIKNGDTANIDYTGYKDGKEFSGGSAEGYDLKIGSGSFIDGFESGLIGVKTGETVNLNLTFPESYGTADLAGADVVFKVKVNSIYTLNYSSEDIAAAKSSLQGTLLLSSIVENSKFDTLPETSNEYYVSLLNTMYTNYAKSAGYDSLEKYLTANNAEKSDFDKQVEQTAEEQLKKDIVAVAIAKNEGLMPTDSEYNEAVTSYAAANSCTESELVANNGKETIEISLLQEKVEGYLKTQSK